MVVAIRRISGEDLENVNTRLQAGDLNKGFEAAGGDFTNVLNSLFGAKP
jgi:hypothetical protein